MKKALQKNNKATLLATALFAALALTAGGSAWAQKLACHNVTIVSPYPPGGTTDILARMLAPSMQQELGVPVIVDNKPGASSNIGTEFVGRAKPDGCTLLLGNNTGVVINRNLYKLRLDPVESLAPIAEVAAVPLVLYVNPSKVAVTTPAELLQELKKDPQKYSFASGGSGSPQHLAGELIKQSKSVEMLHIPYRGQGPALSDVIAGHVPIAFETTTVVLPHVKSGAVRALATTSATRTKVLPDVPTMVESGFPGFVIENWYGVFAPANTPQPIIEQLNKAVNTALRAPNAVEALDKMGSSDVAGPAGQFADFIAKEAPVWTEVVEKSGAKVD
ncbi:Bug family tripartite tricarboxylate transporter substrate binding protein [Pollutimonas bauzanensis]|uniref:Tripartite-type tricarboxylate transporter, receptor component TctC n=1 Tax=Pollutimonas bauzanensis TaxID=658167 RepID=A0A1M5UT92_9BURK|nr:tripartite tricarboxylate transporter substrate binding protein [Pollutimonas bauzanensis]SHH66154.1 Tripartite-type tricarboxylate transporter, receptor component TctC [Pollutimonas bauzanensis]